MPHFSGWPRPVTAWRALGTPICLLKAGRRGLDWVRGDGAEHLRSVGNTLWEMLSEVTCRVPVHSAALNTSSFTVDDFCFISL